MVGRTMLEAARLAAEWRLCASPSSSVPLLLRGFLVGGGWAGEGLILLLDALRRRSGLTVIVSEEVGLSVHPTTELGRRFVDAMGDLNQAVASLAHDVALVVAGRTLWLPAEEAGPR